MTHKYTIHLDSDQQQYNIFGQNAINSVKKVSAIRIDGKDIGWNYFVSLAAGDHIIEIDTKEDTVFPAIYERKSDLVSVTIEEGFTHIERAAFKGCKNLVSVVLPSTLVSIGHEAFADTNVKDVIYPDSIEEFSPVNSERVVTPEENFHFPKSVRVFHKDALSNFKFSKGTFYMPDTLEDIDCNGANYAEESCPRPFLSLPRSVKHLYTEQIPDGIDTLVVPRGITHIHAGAYRAFKYFYVEEGNTTFFTNADHTELYYHNKYCKDGESRTAMKSGKRNRYSMYMTYSYND